MGALVTADRRSLDLAARRGPGCIYQARLAVLKIKPALVPLGRMRIGKLKLDKSQGQSRRLRSGSQALESLGRNACGDREVARSRMRGMVPGCWARTEALQNCLVRAVRGCRGI